MKKWTKKAEFAWLSQHIPEWERLAPDKKRRKKWLATVTSNFLTTFPASGHTNPKLRNVSTCFLLALIEAASNPPTED
jgi:hypothetical protein